MIVNQTQILYKVKRGNTVGKVKTLTPQDLLTVASCEQKGNNKENFMEVDVPNEYYADILGLLKRNSDLFAKKD